MGVLKPRFFGIWKLQIMAAVPAAGASTPVPLPPRVMLSLLILLPQRTVIRDCGPRPDGAQPQRRTTAPMPNLYRQFATR